MKVSGALIACFGATVVIFALFKSMEIHGGVSYVNHTKNALWVSFPRPVGRGYSLEVRPIAPNKTLSLGALRARQGEGWEAFAFLSDPLRPGETSTYRAVPSAARMEIPGKDLRNEHGRGVVAIELRRGKGGKLEMHRVSDR